MLAKIWSASLVQVNEMSDWERGRRLRRARFLSAHFLFTIGSFTQEVPYDPELYFFGEEINLAQRAFTWGYDFFHPQEMLVWHQYNRDGPKHWSDHPGWGERDVLSRAKISQLLLSPAVGILQCGAIRPSAHYEAYLGVNFTERYAEAYTRQNKEPPEPPRIKPVV
jgi:Glycosyltransferase (GlcNAc)